MSSTWPEKIDFLDDITRNLSERDWAISRIHDWINNPDTVPAFLIRGNPGSGKSTLLAQFLTSLPDIAQARNQRAPRVVATVLRHPAYQQPFDATRFLTDIVKGLADFAPTIVVPQFAVDSPVPAEPGGNAAGCGARSVPIDCPKTLRSSFLMRSRSSAARSYSSASAASII